MRRPLMLLLFCALLYPLSAQIDAIYESSNHIFFFHGSTLSRYNKSLKKFDAGVKSDMLTRKVYKGFSDWFVDAAVGVKVGSKEKVYFFIGSEYYTYDKATGKTPTHPNVITKDWVGLPQKTIDGVLNAANGKLYFFYGDEYYRVNPSTKKVDPGYPLKVKDHWKGVWTSGIDAVFRHSGKNKVYFFRGDQYVRYDMGNRKVDPGYPKSIKTWKGIPTNKVKEYTLRFRPSLHGYRFVNYFQVGKVTFGQGTFDVFIPREYLTIHINQSYGLCGGMVMGARKIYYRQARRPIATQPPRNNTPLYNDLVSMLHYSLGGGPTYPLARQVTSAWAEHRGKSTLPEKSVGEYRKIRQNLETGRLAPIFVVYYAERDKGPWDNHQVMVYGYRADKYAAYLRIYDPNRPMRDDVGITLEKRNKDSYLFMSQNTFYSKKGNPRETFKRVFGIIYNPQ